MVAFYELQRCHGPGVALERMHELLCALSMVPFVDADVAVIRGDYEVVHFVVNQQVRYEIFL